jgi:hypothetical protein
MRLVNGLDNVFSGSPQGLDNRISDILQRYPDYPGNQQRASSSSESRGNVHHLSRQRSQRKLLGPGFIPQRNAGDDWIVKTPGGPQHKHKHIHYGVRHYRDVS